MRAVLAVLFALCPSVTGTSKLYRVCFTSKTRFAEADVVLVDKNSAAFCAWDTRDCETADMVVRVSKGPNSFPIYLSYSSEMCR